MHLTMVLTLGVCLASVLFASWYRGVLWQAVADIPSVHDADVRAPRCPPGSVTCLARRH